ncbi:MAG: hypothetical protein ABSF70_09215 [Terracidiphilus sp.]
MVTIRRYPVPADSYNPNGPLNDLMRSQLEHFVEVAKRLPPQLQVNVPVPSADDAPAASRFIAAVTQQLMSVKKSPIRLVKKPAAKTQTPGLAIAASAEPSKSPRTGPKKKTSSKSKTRSQSK